MIDIATKKASIRLHTDSITNLIPGRVWKEKYTATNPGTSHGASAYAHDGNGTIVGLNESGGYPTVLLISNDYSETWETVSPTGDALLDSTNLTYFQGMFIVSTLFGTLKYSYDGRTWAEIPDVPNGSWQFVVNAPNAGFCIFTSVSNNDMIISYDGFTWTLITTGIPKTIRCGMHDSSNLIFGCDDGQIYRSEDYDGQGDAFDLVATAGPGAIISCVFQLGTYIFAGNQVYHGTSLDNLTSTTAVGDGVLTSGFGRRLIICQGTAQYSPDLGETIANSQQPNGSLIQGCVHIVDANNRERYIGGSDKVYISE